MPCGLKKQNDHQAHHHHHQGQKKNRPHQTTITNPQAPPPPEPPQPHTEFLHGGEGLIEPPLPRLHAKEVPAVEHMLHGWQHPYISTAKEKQI